MRKSNYIWVCLILLVGMFFSSSALAGMKDIQARMNQRLAEINSLKKEGVIGENNRGFLEVRPGGAPAQALVTAENADRKKVYAAIAKQTGAGPQKVAKRRAKQIAAKAKPGTWIQDGDGKWVKK